MATRTSPRPFCMKEPTTRPSPTTPSSRAAIPAAESPGANAIAMPPVSNASPRVIGVILDQAPRGGTACTGRRRGFG